MAAPSTATLTVIDVGHGSAVLFEENDATVLVDSGGGIAIVEYLLAAGISTVNSVIISHADLDHIGGLIAMISSGSIQIDRIILNSDGDKASEAWQDLAYELDTINRDGSTSVVPSLREDDLIDTGITDLEIQVIAPRHRLVQLGVGNRDRERNRITSNTMSAVLVASYAGRAVALVPGDLDAVGWSHLRDLSLDLRADILIVPHHGGWGGTSKRTIAMTEEICSAVQPSWVFISNGRGSHGTPREEVVEAIRRVTPQARIACTQVSTRCLSDTIARPEMVGRTPFSAGARSDSCCAGSVRIQLFHRVGAQPELSHHGGFVDLFSSTALCRR